jgi:fatty acyl-CoA reductase
MKHLKSLVHVSSAYSQCDRQGMIEEVNYPTPLPPSKLLGLLDWMTDDQLEILAPTLTTGYPNTYTYTKALAEQVRHTERDRQKRRQTPPPFPPSVSLTQTGCLYDWTDRPTNQLIYGQTDCLYDLLTDQPTDIRTN